MDSSESHLSIPSRFIRYLELQGYTNATIECYLHDLSFYTRHLNKDILAATTSDLEDYLLHLKNAHNYRNSSLSRRVAFLRSFYGFLFNKRIREDNPSLGIKFPRVREKPIPFLSKQDIQKILSVIHNVRDQLIIKTPFYEGLRRMELIGLQKQDIDFTKGTILVHGKGNKQRVLPLHLELRSELREYSKRLQPQHQLIQLVPRMINDIVGRYSKQVGIHCYPHLLRHSFAANLYKRTKNIWLVSKMLGHSKLETTVKYLRSLNILDDFSDEYQKAFSGILS